MTAMPAQVTPGEDQGYDLPLVRKPSMSREAGRKIVQDFPALIVFEQFCPLEGNGFARRGEQLNWEQFETTLKY